MKGLELSRAFWDEELRPAMERECPLLLERAAAGLCGSGSDCLGYDDDISHDHAFAAGCMLWLREEEERHYGFRLSTVYDRLPREFRGVATEHRSRQGDGRYGVKTVEGFFRPFTGTGGAPASWRGWLRVPSWALAAATAGEVFFDGPGSFTAIRQELLTGMPEDVRLKKLAARAALMAQSGQYNFSRCLAHGERAAAQLAAGEFVRESLEMVFLLNRRHMPFYKWAFRAMGELPRLSELRPELEQILTEPTADAMESVAAAVIGELRAQNLTEGRWEFLEPHAYEIMKRIQNPEIAALHIMEG
ncbi:MAG: DUF4037 domain-containing protein [Oscillospiraceae bacterium]|nr:DUF4037 domain-containing protein [Oscillospiraceae bacterium]